MSVRSLNGLAGSSTTNVYVNTIDVFTGTSPIVVAQTSANQPVNISLKDINGFGGANKILKINSSNNGLVWADDTTESITTALPLERTGDSIALKGLSSMGAAGKIIKVNSGGTALEYADEDGSNWTRTTGGLGTVGYLQPAVSTDRVSIPPNSDIVFDNNPVDTDGFVLDHDTTNNAFEIKEKDGTLLLKLNANNMNVEWGTQGFMDFNGKTLHGSNPEYPLGQNIGVGTIGLIFIAIAYIKLITTNEILFNNYNASPFSIQSSIRLNDSGELYNTQGKWKGNTFYVDTNVDMLNNSSIIFREATANGNHRINLIGQSSLSGDFTITLPATTGTVALTSDITADFIQSVSSPLSVSSNNLTLGTVPYNLGGTGITTYTEGDLLYASADNVLAKLPHGNSGDILRMNGVGTLPEWRTMYGATSPIVLTGGTTFELTTVPYNLGGTGQTGYNQGDMLYALTTNNLTKINIGSTGQVLKVASGISIPIWADETDTTYTATSPIFLAGTDFRLTTIPILLGGTNIVSYTEGDILYCSSSTGQGTLSKLPIGSTDQVLKVSGGVPVWGTDTDTVYTVNTPITLTNSTEIGLTTVPYNLGGTGITTYTEGDLLYASADNVLAKLPHGNSGDILRMNGTGTLPEWRTMYSATSPIVLTGGLTFELNTVPVSKGGTGFTGCNVGDMIYSLTNNALTKLNIGSAGQILRVQNGSLIPFWDDETDTTYTGTGNIDITGTTISLTGTIPQSNGGTGFNTYTVGDILYCDTANTLSKLPIGTSGQLLAVSGGKPSWGTFTGGTKWSVGNAGLTTEFIYPTTSTQRVAIGYTTNPDDRRLYVNGDMEADLIFCDEMKNQSGANLVQQNASGYTMFGHDGDDMYLKCDDHLYLRQNGNTTSVDIRNNGNTAATGTNRATDGLYLYLEYFCANISSHFSPAGGRAIGFTSYLNGSYVNNNFPCIATQYVNLYISVDNDSMVSGDRSGAYYAAYFNRYGLNGGSDGRLKKEVETITNAMDIIRQLRGVYFEWNDRPPEATRQTGFIAQEVNEVFPEIGDYDSATDKWALRYEKIAGLYAEGFKELDKENTELKEKVSTLETELTTYKSIVDKLINSKSFAEFKKSL